MKKGDIILKYIIFPESEQICKRMNRMKNFIILLKTLSSNAIYFIWMLFVFSCVTFLFDTRTALIEFGVFLILTVWHFLFRHKKLNSLKKYIKSMNVSLEENKFKTLYDFYIPVCIINQDGIIEWSNAKFSELCVNPVHKLPLSDYIKEFDLNKILKNDLDKDEFACSLKHNNKSYKIYGNLIRCSNVDDEYYIVLYWHDTTEYTELKNRYYAESFVSCVLVIDNYDDVMQSTANQDKPRLTALIEETLDSLAETTSGILKKYEKDKFLLYIQKAHLDKLIEDNFSFTEKLRALSVGNKVAPTLSIGVGVGGTDFQQNDAFGYSALDMALGRGGDQIVIKDSEKFRFYGGKTKEVEKRTRVKARVVSQAIKEMIADSEQIIIMGHRYADVDVLGSALGLYSYIRALGKNAKILLDTYNQTVERFVVKYHDKYNDVFISKAYANEIVSPNTLIFIVDTHKSSIVEEPALIDVSKNIIVIDHHRKSADFIQNTLLTYHEPYASSASELITEMLQYGDDIKLEKAEAEALYAGIFMDTKNFTFKTGVRTFEAASYLKRMGVDTIEVKKLFQIDLNTFVKKWAIIENATTYKTKVAIATCEKNDDDMQTIVAQAADEMLNITNISSSFVICDMGNEIIISARSFGDINVQVITEKLGGGGHMTIAGAQITDKSLDEVTNELKQVLNEYLQ